MASTANPIASRYSDAYSVAKSDVSWGNLVKTLGIVAGIVIALLGLLVGSTFGVAAVILFLIVAAAIGGAFYMFGVMIAAQGQIPRAVLDTAVQHVAPNVGRRKAHRDRTTHHVDSSLHSD